MSILDTSLKNKDTVCSPPHITVSFGQCYIKSIAPSWTFEDPSNMTISDNFFNESIYFILFKNELHMNDPYFLLP